MTERPVSPLVSRRVETSFPEEPRWSAGMTMIFLLDGTLDMQVGAHTYHMRANDFLFFKPYELYYVAWPGQRYRAFVVTVERSLLKSACPRMDAIRFDLQLMRRNEEDAVYQAVCSCLARIVYAMVKPDVCSELAITSACGKLLTRLIEAYGSESGSEPGQPADYARERVLDILQYISENYTERITLNDIAAHVALHPQYFSVFFKKRFGANFSDYLNRYRVGQSLRALCYTNDSVLSIAVANGFNNHKTYAAAFQRVYGMLPRAYRKAFQGAPCAGENDAREEADVGQFRFFQQYWSTDADAPPHIDALKSHQSFSFREGEGGGFPNRMLRMISVGRVLTCLRSDVQQQLRQAKADLRLDYVRMRDVFSDELFLYYEDEDRNARFNWVSIDTVFDFLLSIGVRPYIELGYMPAQLASKKQYASWQYRPNVSMPRSYPAWSLLITRFFEHCIARYGIDEVRAWYFEFWTTPNLRLEMGYWYESQEEFFRFYQVTYETIRRVDAGLRIGTPNFSYPSGMSWYEDFFTFARARDIRPDFLSIHAYGIGDGQREQARMMEAQGSAPLFQPMQPEMDYLRREVEDLLQCSQRCGFGELELIVSDWNITYLPMDYTRDTSFMGPYILFSFAQVLERVRGLCFWSLSDIHEEFFYSDTLFHGGPGLVDYNGIPKAAYHALAFVYALGETILQVGDNHILARDGQDYQLVLFNLAFFDQHYRVPNLSALTYAQRYNVYEAVHSLSFHMSMEVKPGKYTITHRRLNRESGSCYDLWLKMGKPGDLRGGLTEHLKARCIPDIYVESAIAAPRLVFDARVEPHGVTFITIHNGASAASA